MSSSRGTYTKGRTWRAIGRRVQNRAQQGKQSVVYVNGTAVLSEKLKKETLRHRPTITEQIYSQGGPSPGTPEGVEIITPSARAVSSPEDSRMADDQGGESQSPEISSLQPTILEMRTGNPSMGAQRSPEPLENDFTQDQPLNVSSFIPSNDLPALSQHFPSMQQTPTHEHGYTTQSIEGHDLNWDQLLNFTPSVATNSLPAGHEIPSPRTDSCPQVAEKILELAEIFTSHFPRAGILDLRVFAERIVKASSESERKDILMDFFDQTPNLLEETVRRFIKVMEMAVNNELWVDESAWNLLVIELMIEMRPGRDGPELEMAESLLRELIGDYAQRGSDKLMVRAVAKLISNLDEQEKLAEAESLYHRHGPDFEKMLERDNNLYNNLVWGVYMRMYLVFQKQRKYEQVEISARRLVHLGMKMSGLSDQKVKLGMHCLILVLQKQGKEHLANSYLRQGEAEFGKRFWVTESGDGLLSW